MRTQSRFVRLLGLAAAALLFSQCTDAQDTPDVMSELPGEVTTRVFSLGEGLPRLDCTEPADIVMLPPDALRASVSIPWKSNVEAALRAGSVQLLSYDNGIAAGRHSQVSAVDIELAYGEHTV
ncbi:MAG: hypothetical protein VX223_03160, partial [Myxococcota bacterium]|nr:hypothetical protein [Myxococcota bacterium]